MYKAAVITVSDSCFQGKNKDLSGPLLVQLLEELNMSISETALVPDEPEEISSTLIRICDDNLADLILTTGGTGLGPRDTTPEATEKVIEREVPGIMEWIRMKSMEITPRALLSRGKAGIRKKTLIINFPGSTKAVKENLELLKPILNHALETLTQEKTDCGRG